MLKVEPLKKHKMGKHFAYIKVLVSQDFFEFFFFINPTHLGP